MDPAATNRAMDPGAPSSGIGPSFLGDASGILMDAADDLDIEEVLERVGIGNGSGGSSSGDYESRGNVDTTGAGAPSPGPLATIPPGLLAEVRPQGDKAFGPRGRPQTAAPAGDGTGLIAVAVGGAILFGVLVGGVVYLAWR